ncbi:MAG: N-6 DNA methylase [Meiothermus sp.]|uniref:N-6 DNA methylase n=1 Tax=Meiothermus sp. TaxID=1955249 RepID=UPI00298F3C49|nr:N-6 DNA methylase [Meiothermus sp.]MDW8424854.1 N-6 DNA methylase [Meiothermus sp.]
MLAGLLPQNPTGPSAKALGAYYTDTAVARFLVRWALRSPHETLADPAFGGGVFLAAASERLRQLGGQARGQIFGVELDEAVHRQTARALEAHFAIPPAQLYCGDFFDLRPCERPVDAMVGNPPFIRYQRFGGAGREKALRRALEQGLRLNQRAGSWAAFAVHAAAFLRSGGRLGLVLPAELGHAAYARPVLEYLVRSFEQVLLITFRERLFPHLSQDTLLLLAEGRGAGSGAFSLLDLQSAAELEKISLPHPQAERLEAAPLLQGRTHLPLYWLPPPTRALYQALAENPQTFRLGQVAEVGIGYVTGHNEFFHLHPEQAAQWGLPPAFLKPAVRRGRALRGLRLTEANWRAAVQAGEAGLLLHIPPEASLPSSVRAYLEQGQARGVPQAYKCRVRQPWYSVPQVHRPDGFLSYMSGQAPSLVANEAGAVAPNSLHTVRLKTAELSAKALAALWQTSLTRLSAELEGHAMGGGMLKLEPKEAERVVLARLTDTPGLEALADELDALLKQGQHEPAQALADRVILLEGLGLSPAEVARLSRAGRYLRLRRQRRLAGF